MSKGTRTNATFPYFPPGPNLARNFFWTVIDAVAHRLALAPLYDSNLKLFRPGLFTRSATWHDMVDVVLATLAGRFLGAASAKSPSGGPDVQLCRGSVLSEP